MGADEDAEDVSKRRKLDADSVRAMTKQSIESKRIEDERQERKDEETEMKQAEEEETAPLEAPQPFYLVRARSLRDSSDPRANRERLLLEMAKRIRDCPTIPADPEDANQVWPAALAEDMAVELPRVHCSFRGCCWCGITEDERDAHILMTHREELLPIADTLPKCFSEKTRIESVYNEAIATKTRQGAPVACFALQRRAVNSLSLIHI